MTWRDIARRQSGVIARRQARRAGMSEDAWQWQYDSERWQSPHPGVAITHCGTPTWAELAWAAVLWTGDEARLDGLSAAFDAGLQVDQPSVITTFLPPTRTRRSTAQVKVRRLAVPASDLRTQPDRPPSLVPSRAVLHAAAWARSDREAEFLTVRSVQQQCVDVDELHDVLSRCDGLPRRALLHTVLSEVGAGVAAMTELDFLRRLDDWGLPRPDRLQWKVRADGRRYLDAWWERQRVTVELDGGHHRLVDQWNADLLRSNAIGLSLRGGGPVTQLRYSSGNLRHDGAQVRAQLASALL